MLGKENDYDLHLLSPGFATKELLFNFKIIHSPTPPPLHWPEPRK